MCLRRSPGLMLARWLASRLPLLSPPWIPGSA
jgi:hypothetical protein